MPTTMLNSKTVTLDELGLRAVPATPTMISQIMTSIGMTVPPRYADTSPAFFMFVLWFIKASRVGRRSVKGNYPPRTPLTYACLSSNLSRGRQPCQFCWPVEQQKSDSDD